MTELNKVWVTDTRDKDPEPFLHPEHLLKFSKHLKKASRPKPRHQTKVTEPATSGTNATTTTSSSSKKKD